MIQEGASASPYFLQPFHALDGMVSAAGDGEPGAAAAASDMHCHALLYNLSVLKDKVQQLHPLVGLAVAHDGPDPVAVSSAGAVIQEIIGAASSMMYAFQQLCLGPTTATTHDMGVSVHCSHSENDTVASGDQVIMNHVLQQLQHHGGYNRNDSSTAAGSAQETDQAVPADMIIELDAAELLAKYTHYCQVCGKGFKRDANLRMHMRAHGDEYKTNAALANPARPIGEDRTTTDVPALAAAERKYSCPQEGCRWNRKHARFQPLKSVVCVKNHYRRSHCPKMYVCKRCSRKQFSVLSDLRTHEKHCGDHRWLCSCGTSFSRKDKLLGHVALFAGHAPNVPLESLVGARHGKRSAHPGNGNAIASDIGMGTT